MNWHEGAERVARWVRRHGVLTALMVLVAGWAIGVHRNGHSWGDDFTLYLRQSKSLLDGNVGQVIADNHFNVDNAAKPGFSPYVYPWGWPLLLAPFYRLFGLDYERLKLVEVACFIGFLLAFHAVIRRRLQQWAAFATAAFVGTTFVYLQHTGQLVSELPYMLFVGITLWYLDRLRHEQPLDAAGRRQLILLGLLAMFVFNIRREGLAIVAAIGVAQLLDLRGRWRQVNWRQVAAPFVSFGVSVVLLQFMLPSALAPEYEDSGLHQTWKKVGASFRTSFARQLGFESLAGVGLLLVVLLVVAGVIVRMWNAPRTDAPLFVFAVGSLTIVGMIPAVADRYTMGVTPFAVYFAVQAIAAIPLPRTTGPWLAVAVVGLLSVVHLTELPSSVADAQEFNDTGQVVDGPEAPYAQAAFSAIRTYTHQDDVVAFFKARALTFYTNRRAVQSSDLEIVRQRADYFMSRTGSSFSQPEVTEAEAAEMGWVAVWSDDTWVLWRLPLYESS